MVSIIMPTYNRAYIIERAVNSVLKQTYDNWELIIVDDASSDDTAQVLQKYVGDKIHYYRNDINQGANISRNIGVGYAKGEILAFLDSDNFWPVYKLELQLEVLDGHLDNRCFLYGKTHIIDNEFIRTIPEKALTTSELRVKELEENVVDTNTILIKKELFLEVGGFDRNIPRLQDWELVLRMLYLFSLEGIGIDTYLSYNEIQENSIGNENAKFIEALGFLYKTYMCNYVDEDKMLDYLQKFIKENAAEKELVKRILIEIGSENTTLFPMVLERLEKKNDMFQSAYHMEQLLYKWHENNSWNKKGTFFSNYFYEGSKIQRIAIYGLGKLGTLFYNEIKGLPVKVVYGIDREKKLFDSLLIRHPNEKLEEVDWLVITILEESEGIKSNLRSRYKGKIVTLDELIFGQKSL